MNATNEYYLAELKTFFTDAEVCRHSSRLVEHLSIRLAALGEAEQVLTIVNQSPEAGLFDGLAHGLQLYLGQPVENAADRAVEVATQIGNATTDFAFDHEAIADFFFQRETVSMAA
ncbi:MAG TPA: hypothetical protein VK717_08580 [Opitutaceae bacterium]|jgi:hypothetical protein|nr:hypothetical protein [Opitutaceae bacterium]